MKSVECNFPKNYIVLFAHFDFFSAKENLDGSNPRKILRPWVRGPLLPKELLFYLLISFPMKNLDAWNPRKFLLPWVECSFPKELQFYLLLLFFFQWKFWWLKSQKKKLSPVSQWTCSFPKNYSFIYLYIFFMRNLDGWIPGKYPSPLNQWTVASWRTIVLFIIIVFFFSN